MVSTKLETNVITLTKGNGAKATLKLGEQSPTEFLGWDEAVACYKRASDRIDKIFELGKKHSTNPELDFFLWEGSYHWIKHDSLAGPILWVYLSEVLKVAVHQFSIKIIYLDNTAPPKAFLDFCVEEVSLEVIRPSNLYDKLIWTTKTKQYIKNNLQFIRIINQAIKLAILVNVSKNVQNLQKDSRPIILMARKSFSNHRFGFLINKIKDDFNLIGVPPKELIENKLSSYENKIISCYSSLELLDILKSITKAIKVFSQQNKVQKQILARDCLIAKLIQQTIVQIFQVILQSSALERLLIKLSPIAFISGGAFNGPIHRRRWLACKKVGIKSICIMQKSVNKSSVAFKFNYPNSWESIPDYFIVHQESSKQTLLNWGVPENKIKIGYRGSILNQESNSNQNRVLSKAVESKKSDSTVEYQNTSLLVLLDCHLSINEKMISDSLELVQNYAINLLVRQHPNLPIQKQESVLSLLHNKNYQDVSNWGWNEFISSGNTITITPCSSAAIEAMMQGSLLLWVPYYTDIAVVNHQLINSFGKVCNCYEDLFQYIDNWLNQSEINRQQELAKYKNQFEMNYSYPSGDLVSQVFSLLKQD